MMPGTLRRLPATLVAFALLLAAGVSARAEEFGPMLRWTTQNGQFFDARFVRLHGTEVIVGRDGLEFSVAIATLTPASLEQARRQAVRVQTAVTAQPPPLPPVASFDFGPSVLTFCQDNVGKLVGTGQCGSLPAQALRSIGVAPRVFPESPGEGDYVWGDLVALVQVGFFGLKGVKDLAHVAPGDIVQFHGTRFTGYDHSDNGVYRMEAMHHTAVVESVDYRNRTITVLHQNWNNQQIVRRQTLFLRGMTSGWLRFYRPTAVSSGGPISALPHSQPPAA